VHTILKILQRFFHHGLIGKRILGVIVFTLSLNLFFGTLFYWVEKDVQPALTIQDSIWWAMVTMTTVGYGDFSAQTFVGRFVISYACMLLGIGLIGFVVGFIADHIIVTFTQTKRGLMKIFEENHLIICNCPSEIKILEIIKEFTILDEYKRKGIVIIDEDIEQLPPALQQDHIHFVKGSPTQESILMRANILQCNGILVLAKNPELAASDEKTFTIGSIIEMISKEQGCKLKVVTEVVNQKNLKLLQLAEVDGMVTSEGITSRLLVQEFLYPGVHDIFQQLLSNSKGSQFYIFATRLIGFKVVDLQLAIIKHPVNIQIIGLLREEQQILNPPKEMVIQAGDRLILLAEKAMDFNQIEHALL